MDLALFATSGRPGFRGILQGSRHAPQQQEYERCVAQESEAAPSEAVGSGRASYREGPERRGSRDQCEWYCPCRSPAEITQSGQAGRCTTNFSPVCCCSVSSARSSGLPRRQAARVTSRARYMDLKSPNPQCRGHSCAVLHSSSMCRPRSTVCR